MLVNILQHRHICSGCGSSKTTLKQGKYERWYNSDDGILCHKCYQKLKGYPRYGNPKNKEFNEKHNKNRLAFKDKRFLLNWNPRNDICSKCGECDEKTAMHHALGYYIIFPWYGTVELCPTCHIIEENKGRIKNDQNSQ